MTDLLYLPANNVGGNYALRLVPVAGVNSTTGPTVGLRNGWRWYQAYGTEHTRHYEERQSQTDNGPIWEVTVQLFLPGDTTDRRAQLAEMARHRFILQVEDNQGLLRQVGSYSQPLEFTYQFSTGKTVSDLRGYALTFRGTLSVPPPIV